MAVAQTDAPAPPLHDQLTLVGARDEARDGDSESLRNGRHQVDAGPFLDDREARAASHDPHVWSKPLTARLSVHRRVRVVQPMLPVPRVQRVQPPVPVRRRLRAA